MGKQTKSAGLDPVKKLVQRCHSALCYAAFFSIFVNLLQLTVPLYMLQIFDRVLASQSIATLIYLTLIAIVALFVLMLLDMSRSRMTLKVGQWLDQKLGMAALSRSIDDQLLGGQYGKSAIYDVATIRQFLGGGTVFVFFDAPWIVIYILIVYFLSVMLGVIATVGAVVLIILAFVNEWIARQPNQLANAAYSANQQVISSMLNQTESVQAMGMQVPILQQWQKQNAGYLGFQRQASQRTGMITSIAKFIRMVLQITLLAVGAYYILQGQLSPGAMIAASIIMGRGLAPIEQSISGWKTLLDTFNAYKRLHDFMKVERDRHAYAGLPKPTGVLQVESLSYSLTAKSKPILHNIHFHLMKGQSLAVIGPSGAGKSTLLRLVVGLWRPSFGAVRLDGVEMYHWDHQEMSKYIGYLPQEDSLFPVSVKQNIAKMQAVDNEKLTVAAELVNTHQMILHLPSGYDSIVSGYTLSAGQKQRVALTRAFYDSPCLVVLDEPESNLDQEGLISLQNTLLAAGKAGITIVYATQRPELAAKADQVLVIKDGQQKDYGPSSQILEKWQR